uniref:RING-type E3 ubiquitin transferase n=1 Tax=Rhipicephalus appendiculatus TaxID=34631 RepID=A0A131Y9T3_RHIAP
MGADYSTSSSWESPPLQRPTEGTQSNNSIIGVGATISMDIVPRRLQENSGGVSARVRKPSPYYKGQIVRICGDLTRVKQLQQGHGDYNSAMESALGRLGRIVEVDSDGDINVKCPGGLTWYFNPDCVEPVLDEDSECDDIDFDEVVPVGLDGIIRDLLEVEPNEGRRNYIATTPKMKMMPLHGACHVGNRSLVKMMAMTGMELNRGDKDGDTPLHYAVYGNRPEILELLINFGANVNVRNRRKYTPIHVAVIKQLARCVSVLSNCTARLDVNTQDKYGDTPLHDAVQKPRQDIVNLLLTFPTIDMAVKNKSGYNALHQAALKGNERATALLT